MATPTYHTPDFLAEAATTNREFRERLSIQDFTR